MQKVDELTKKLEETYKEIEEKTSSLQVEQHKIERLDYLVNENDSLNRMLTQQDQKIVVLETEVCQAKETALAKTEQLENMEPAMDDLTQKNKELQVEIKDL